MTFKYIPPKNWLAKLKYMILSILFSLVLYVAGVIFVEIGIMSVLLFMLPNGLAVVLNYIPNKLFSFETLSLYGGVYVIALIVMLLVGIIMNVTNLASLGARKTTYLYVRFARSWIGRLLSWTPFFDFTSGEWMVEKNVSEEIDMSRPRSMFKEILYERWYETLGIPTLFLVFVLTMLTKLRFITTLIVEDEMAFYAVSIGVAAVMLFFVILFTPALMVLYDAEIKLVEIGDDGDVDSVIFLSSILKNGITYFLGFTAFLGFSEIILDSFINALTKNGLQISTNLTADIAAYVLTYVYALGYFLIFVAFLLPAIALMLLPYMKDHPKHIDDIREKVVANKICKSVTISPKYYDDTERNTPPK